MTRTGGLNVKTRFLQEESLYPHFGGLGRIGNMLHYHTAGESHGKALVTLVDGFPAGVEIREEPIDAEFAAARRDTAAAAGSSLKRTTSRSSAASGTARRLAARSPFWSATTTTKSSGWTISPVPGRATAI